jgi:N-acetylglucosaminyldiphosphoundecaprenol N-acetyl-beta-D-mannosaminyltransferase
MNYKISKTINILGLNVNNVTFSQTTEQILEWALIKESRYLCVANVHMVMEAYDDSEFKSVVNNGDLVIPDGKPLALLMSLQGSKKQFQIRGPELTLQLCSVAQEKDIKVGFYGSSPKTIKMLMENMRRKFPNLDVAYAYSPPFRSLTQEEDDQVIKSINDSEASLLFVGLGCPKQERWMAEHRGVINSVMIGVGQAFDIHAGTLAEAPAWLRFLGLEWLFRLMSEPRRLWKRYLKNNPRFASLAILQIIGLKKF